MLISTTLYQRVVAAVVVGALLVPQIGVAATVFNTLPEPYALYELPADLPAVYDMYGSLDGYPDTYQFTVTASTSVSFTLYAVDETDADPAFSGIVVAEEDARGVREVLRMPSSALAWELYRDDRTRMRYQRSETRSAELAPGTYRVEVSTPDNAGRYRLELAGTAAKRAGYGETVRDIWAIQRFHEVAWWHIFRTGAVLLPLLSLGVVLGLIGTWWYARRRGFM